MEKKQTAVEWLVEQLKDYDFADIKDDEYYIIKIPTWILKEKEIQAKEMEKEQIMDAYYMGDSYSCCGCYDSSTEEESEDYYNKTFNK